MRTHDRETRERGAGSSSRGTEGAMDQDHVDKFFEARKHDKTVLGGVRASTTNLESSTSKMMSRDYSSYNLSALERELAKQRQQGNSGEVIGILQAKVKLPSLDSSSRKKVLIDLLLELLNARKVLMLGETLKHYRGKIDVGEEEGFEYFQVCFQLFELIVESL